MLQKWIERAIKNALFKEFCDMQIALDLLQREMNACSQKLDVLLNERLLLNERAKEQEKIKGPEIEPEPLAQSRPSWPRMKKHLEERDVRGLLDEQRTSERDFIGQRKPSASAQADAIASYWREKQERS